MAHYAIIDIGTTSIKSFIVNDNGKILGKSIKEYKSLSPTPTQHEQDPEKWWSLAGETMREALKMGKVDEKEIAALALITQRATLIPIDKMGKPLYNAITWMDSRNIDLKEEEKTILKQRVPLKNIIWFKRNSTEIYNGAYRFVLVDSFFSYRLVGEAYSSPSQGIYLYYDPEKGKYDEEILGKFDIDVGKLPKIVESSTVVGELAKEAAEHLSLGKGDSSDHRGWRSTKFSNRIKPFKTRGC